MLGMPTPCLPSIILSETSHVTFVTCTKPRKQGSEDNLAAPTLLCSLECTSALETAAVQAQKRPEWQIRHRGAWAGSKLYLRSQTSTFQMAYSTCKGSADEVLALWTALGFEVAYDIVKDGVTGICHNAGFAITAVWSKVRESVLSKRLHQ